MYLVMSSRRSLARYDGRCPIDCSPRTNAGYDLSVGGFAANAYGKQSPGVYKLIASFVTEVVLTLFFVFTVLGSTDLKAPVGFAGIPIGIVLALIHLVGIPVTNTSVNPARSIGPASKVFDGVTELTSTQ